MPTHMVARVALRSTSYVSPRSPTPLHWGRPHQLGVTRCRPPELATSPRDVQWRTQHAPPGLLVHSALSCHVTMLRQLSEPTPLALAASRLRESRPSGFRQVRPTLLKEVERRYTSTMAAHVTE